MLYVSTLGRFQSRTCIVFITSPGQEEENKILYIAMKKWEQLQSTFDNLKSGMGQGDYLDKKQKLFKTMSIRVIIYEFYRFCSERNR